VADILKYLLVAITTFYLVEQWHFKYCMRTLAIFFLFFFDFPEKTEVFPAAGLAVERVWFIE
jgi:hypothetical protein